MAKIVENQNLNNRGLTVLHFQFVHDPVVQLSSAPFPTLSNYKIEHATQLFNGPHPSCSIVLNRVDQLSAVLNYLRLPITKLST